MASKKCSPASYNDSSSEAKEEAFANDEIVDNPVQLQREIVLGLPAVAAGGNLQNHGDRITCIGRNNEVITWGCRLDQGSRRHMEDRIVTLPTFLSMSCNHFGGCTTSNSEFASNESPIFYFGVFDGHGGSQVSDYCAISLHEAVAEAWRNEGSTERWNDKWESAISRAYETVDNACKEKPLVGSTALVVIISPCQIIAANCGDSRAVLCRGTHIITLTHDHKPDRQDEAQRIAESGGTITEDKWGVLRVQKLLAMTRAIGDWDLKPYVTSVPELTFTTRDEEDECIVLASDGLWDVMTTEEVGRVACEQLRRERQAARTEEETPSQLVADYLLQEARDRVSLDNFSVIVVDLKPISRHHMQQ